MFMNPSVISFQSIPTLKMLKEAYPGVRSLLFDMDGTLFNTETYHAEALILMAKKYDIRPPHSPDVVHQMMVGKADHLVFDLIKTWPGVPTEWTAQDFILDKNKYLIELLTRVEPSQYFPDLTHTLLKEAMKQDLFLGLVTSSEKVITEKLLQMANVKDYFKLILTRDDCPHHKPHPWPYLKAMDISGFNQKETLIFEDSGVGISAAQDAGAHVIKVEWF